MSEQDNLADENSTINLETEETTEESSQENFESESHDSQDNGETPKSREWKEKLREEKKALREAAQEVPKLKAELEFNKFLRKHPEAEDYEQDITEFRAKNPTIGLEQAYKYVLADKDPAKLAQLADSWNYAQANQGKTAPASGEKSFSEHVWGNVNLNDLDSLRKEAEKAYANIQV